jgi:hypothetical protein
MFVVGLLAATFLLVPTGLRAQGDGDQGKGDHCSPEKCLLGTFNETVHANGMTFKALLTVSPGGGAVETNTAQGSPVTVHGSWQASKDKDGRFDLTFITLALTSPPGPAGFLPAHAMTKETITLDESGNSFTAVFQVDEMTPNGTVIFTIRGTATGERILVVPLN